MMPCMLSFLDVLRFWLDRGADGVRIDSAALLAKDPELREVPPEGSGAQHPFIDLDAVHEGLPRMAAPDRQLPG